MNLSFMKYLKATDLLFGFLLVCFFMAFYYTIQGIYFIECLYHCGTDQAVYEYAPRSFKFYLANYIICAVLLIINTIIILNNYDNTLIFSKFTAREMKERREKVDSEIRTILRRIGDATNETDLKMLERKLDLLYEIKDF